VGSSVAKKTTPSGQKIGTNSPQTGKTRTVPPEETRRRQATKKRNRAKAELDKAARSRGGTIGAGTGSMWGEVSDEAILNMAQRQGKKK